MLVLGLIFVGFSFDFLLNLWLDFYVLYNGGSGLQWLSGGEQIVEQLCRQREREWEMEKKRIEEVRKGLTMRE